MARKGILTPATEGAKPQRKAAERMMPRGAVGALQSSLSRLQENAVQDIDPMLIDPAGYVDRLGTDDTADTALQESLRVYGQQVPVLLRPSATQSGRYDIVYGRRRVIALKALGLPVKAMIRQLDDQALVLAQGQENTARQDLSFIEKASFAAQLDTADYDRPTIAAALSMDLPMVSRMLKVGHAFDLELLRDIGSAPGIGRDRWMALAEAIKAPRTRAYIDEMAVTLKFIEKSDDRFEQVLAWSQGSRKAVPGARAKPVTHRLTDDGGAPLADMKRTARALTLSVPASGSDGFDAWLEIHAETVLRDLHAQWQSTQPQP